VNLSIKQKALIEVAKILLFVLVANLLVFGSYYLIGITNTVIVLLLFLFIFLLRIVYLAEIEKQIRINNCVKNKGE
jgi:hypothetical protein